MDTREALFYIVKNKIEGDLVECGVYKGDHPKKMADFFLHEKKRDIWLYDTFKGLTQPGEFDYTRNDATLYQMSKDQVKKFWEDNKISEDVNGWCMSTLNEVKSNVESSGYPKEKIHYIEGDVMETLKDDKNIPASIAILRLDTDWYSSSKYEMERLYPKLVSGGVLILDDYFHWDGQRRAVDEYFKENNIHENILRYNSKVGSFIKP